MRSTIGCWARSVASSIPVAHAAALVGERVPLEQAATPQAPDRGVHRLRRPAARGRVLEQVEPHPQLGEDVGLDRRRARRRRRRRRGSRRGARAAGTSRATAGRGPGRARAAPPCPAKSGRPMRSAAASPARRVSTDAASTRRPRRRRRARRAGPRCPRARGPAAAAPPSATRAPGPRGRRPGPARTRRTSTPRACRGRRRAPRRARRRSRRGSRGPPPPPGRRRLAPHGHHGQRLEGVAQPAGRRRGGGRVGDRPRPGCAEGGPSLREVHEADHGSWSSGRPPRAAPGRAGPPTGNRTRRTPRRLIFCARRHRSDEEDAWGRSVTALGRPACTDAPARPC